MEVLLRMQYIYSIQYMPVPEGFNSKKTVLAELEMWKKRSRFYYHMHLRTLYGCITQAFVHNYAAFIHCSMGGPIFIAI